MLRRFHAVFLAILASAPCVRAADPTTYFPDHTSLVVSFSVKQFLQAPLVRDNNSIRTTTDDMVKALDTFGIDSRKDLDRIVLAVSDNGLVLLDGRFDADKFVGRMKEKARERKDDIQVIDEGGATIFQCRLPPSGRNAKIALPDHFLLTVFDSNTIALAVDRVALSEGLAKKAGRRKADLKPRLVELFGRIDSKESLSIVFVPAADQGGPLAGLTAVTGGMTVTDGVTTEVRMDAKDADAAKLVADTAREALAKVRDILPGLAALQLGLDRQAQDAVREMADSFKVTTSQNAVVIGGAISKELIDKAIKKAP